ncbi:hypothetical protein [Mucilaginibacter gotjawali]|uniref:Uncharacterized protein n=1 Tax=Mucilaginibacter gotjawali TaxID=1550579 RepID=A0A839SHB3_9SPHI|nr:hypothetical protein [Mucilaginibacter gotjawali]MBB3056722.1 hypothetical protein [Mucilaginibacter gotjawali]
MKKAPPELALLKAIQRHKGLGPFHISLYTAILSLWQEQQYSTPFRVTRSRLMSISGIRSPATYHKCLKELIGQDYVIYEPSFDKHIASRITLVTSAGCT